MNLLDWSLLGSAIGLVILWNEKVVPRIFDWYFKFEAKFDIFGDWNE
jgi:hypothetical protein